MEEPKREQTMAYGRRFAFGLFFALATWFVVSSTWQITVFALGTGGRAEERTQKAAATPLGATHESPHAPQ